MTTRLLMSPWRRAELGLDVAASRRALQTNSVIYAMRHAPALLDCARGALGRDAIAALRDALRAIADGERWTDVTARRLRTALVPLRRAAQAGQLDPDCANGVGWHLARLDEIFAQHETLRHREALLAMATTDRSAIRTETARARRIRAALQRRNLRPRAPAA